jgi:hypothetical protein
MSSRHLAAFLLLAACSDATGGGPDAAPRADAPPLLDAPGGCPLAVNEVAAAGDPEDWFELLNVSSAPVDLGGFMYIDEADDPARAVPLLATVLAPGGRHVQEVSDADAGFQLGGTDALWLYRVGTTSPCDGVAWSSGDSPSGGSYSRIPDGTGDFETTEPDTRGVTNR